MGGRGEWGWGETPHLNISTPRSVARDSGWIWSENCCLFKERSLGKVGQFGGFGGHIRGTCWGDTDVLDKTEPFDLGQGNGFILDFVYSLDKCIQTCGTRRLVLMSAVMLPHPKQAPPRFPWHQHGVPIPLGTLLPSGKRAHVSARQQMKN